MDRIQFEALHAECVTALAKYVNAAEQTAATLEKCTSEPMSLGERLDLLVQERYEEQAHSVYLETKRVLRYAAKLGYHNSKNQPSRPTLSQGNGLSSIPRHDRRTVAN